MVPPCLEVAELAGNLEMALQVVHPVEGAAAVLALVRPVAAVRELVSPEVAALGELLVTEVADERLGHVRVAGAEVRAKCLLGPELLRALAARVWSGALRVRQLAVCVQVALDGEGLPAGGALESLLRAVHCLAVLRECVLAFERYATLIARELPLVAVGDHVGLESALARVQLVAVPAPDHLPSRGAILGLVKGNVVLQAVLPPELTAADGTRKQTFTASFSAVLGCHVLAQFVRSVALLLAEGAAELIFAAAVPRAFVDLQGERRREQDSTDLTAMLEAFVSLLVPSQADCASKGARAGRAVKLRLHVRLQVAVHHGSLEKRLAAHLARHSVEHEVLRPMLVQVGLPVERLAALEAVESVSGGVAASRLVDGLQHLRVAVAEVLHVVRVGVVLRLAREAVRLEVRVGRGEVLEVGAPVVCNGEADDAGEDACRLRGPRWPDTGLAATGRHFVGNRFIGFIVVGIVTLFVVAVVERGVHHGSVVLARLLSRPHTVRRANGGGLDGVFNTGKSPRHLGAVDKRWFFEARPSCALHVEFF